MIICPPGLWLPCCICYEEGRVDAFMLTPLSLSAAPQVHRMYHEVFSSVLLACLGHGQHQK